MDLRTKKTLSSINNAFIELRSKKPLNKITVKELCDLAMISKPTFYSHYTDIYDLSDKMEDEIIDSILSSTDFLQEPLDNLAGRYRNIFNAFMSQGQLLKIIFSFDRKLEFSYKLERSFREKIFEKFPEYRENTEALLVIDYMVYGSFHTVMLNPELNSDTSAKTLGRLNELIINSFSKS